MGTSSDTLTVRIDIKNIKHVYDFETTVKKLLKINYFTKI